MSCAGRGRCRAGGALSAIPDLDGVRVQARAINILAFGLPGVGKSHALAALIFSDWDRIFKNKMATSAAIDRLVHHSVVLEFVVPSYRNTNGRNG